MHIILNNKNNNICKFETRKIRRKCKKLRNELE